MNAFTPYLCGFLVAAVPAGLWLMFMHDDLRRARRRLNEIIKVARATDTKWRESHLTDLDWPDLYDAIQPYEDA